MQPVPPASAAQPSGPSRARAGVLTPAGLAFVGGPAVGNPRDLPWVLERALAAGLRQVWVGPRQTAELGLDVVALVDGRDYRGPVHLPGGQAWLAPAKLAGWTSTPAEPAPWLELRRGDARVELVFPGWDDGNPFGRAATPRQLVDALELYAGLLRLRYRWSPGATGLALMRAVHSGPGAIALEEAPKLPPPALEPPEHGQLDRHLGALPSTGWLHCWDLNAQYLAACSSVELGFGEAARWRAKPREGWRGGPTAGYYSASIRGAAPIPPPFPVDGKLHWYPAPSIELALELGLQVTIREAWVYPSSRRWLAPWYERLRDARTDLEGMEGPAAAVALGAVKATYTWAVGRLAGSWLQPGDATFRPDWRHAILARARANFYRHLLRVAGAGFQPVASNADAVVYASEFENPSAAAKHLGLEVSHRLGKFKHVGSLSAAEARGAVAGRKSPAGRLRGLLTALEASSAPR